MPRYVKFTLQYEEANFAENIWLKVHDFDEEFYYGMVANNTVGCDMLKVGDLIKVRKKDILYFSNQK